MDEVAHFALGSRLSFTGDHRMVKLDDFRISECVYNRNIHVHIIAH